MMLDIVSPYSNFEIEISVYLKCFGMTVVMLFYTVGNFWETERTSLRCAGDTDFLRVLIRVGDSTIC